MIKIAENCSFKLYTNSIHDNKDKEYKIFSQSYFIIPDAIYDVHFINSNMVRV